MGQSQEPLGPNSQQLQINVAATAAAVPSSYPATTAAGSATFTYQSVPDGNVWTGTLTIAGAPLTAAFTANCGSTVLGSWGGPTVYGPIQLTGNQQLVITATGLSPGVAYTCCWQGANDTKVPAPTWPDANSSSLAVQASNAYDVLSSSSGLGWSYVSYATAFKYTATRTYQGFTLNIGNVGGAVTSALTANVFNAGQGVGKSELVQRTIPLGSQPVSPTAWTLYFPLTVNVGDLVYIWFTGVSAQWTNNSLWLPFGYYSTPVTPITNPPQQALDVVSYGGLLQAQASVSSGGVQVLLTTPPSGYCYRLHSLIVGWQSSSVGGGVNLFNNDTAKIIGFAQVGLVSGVMGGYSELGGQLCTGAVSVNPNVPATVVNTIAITYDLVEIPGII